MVWSGFCSFFFSSLMYFLICLAVNIFKSYWESFPPHCTFYGSLPVLIVIILPNMLFALNAVNCTT